MNNKDQMNKTVDKVSKVFSINLKLANRLKNHTNLYTIIILFFLTSISLILFFSKEQLINSLDKSSFLNQYIAFILVVELMLGISRFSYSTVILPLHLKLFPLNRFHIVFYILVTMIFDLKILVFFVATLTCCSILGANFSVFPIIFPFLFQVYIMIEILILFVFLLIPKYLIIHRENTSLIYLILLSLLIILNHFNKLSYLDYIPPLNWLSNYIQSLCDLNLKNILINSFCILIIIIMGFKVNKRLINKIA